MTNKELTWEEIKKSDKGAILHDEIRDGLRFIVMRGPAALCAYIGVPITHPLAGMSYDDLPVSAHGGLTFGGEGKPGSVWPEGYYWYGWDYGHLDDYAFYYDEEPIRKVFQESGSANFHTKDKKWLVKDVVEDSWNALYDFGKLMKLVEQVANRSKK